MTEIPKHRELLKSKDEEGRIVVYMFDFVDSKGNKKKRAYSPLLELGLVLSDSIPEENFRLAFEKLLIDRSEVALRRTDLHD